MKLILLGIVLAIVVSAIILLFKIVAGAIGLIGGFINAVLGVVVIVATLLIILWMFRYASKNK